MILLLHLFAVDNEKLFSTFYLDSHVLLLYIFFPPFYRNDIVPIPTGSFL